MFDRTGPGGAGPPPGNGENRRKESGAACWKNRSTPLEVLRAVHGPASIAIGLVVSWLIVRGMARPVHSLRHVLLSLAGACSRTRVVQTGDEIGDMSGAFRAGRRTSSNHRVLPCGSRRTVRCRVHAAQRGGRARTCPAEDRDELGQCERIRRRSRKATKRSFARGGGRAAGKEGGGAVQERHGLASAMPNAFRVHSAPTNGAGDVESFVLYRPKRHRIGRFLLGQSSREGHCGGGLYRSRSSRGVHEPGRLQWVEPGIRNTGT